DNCGLASTATFTLNTLAFGKGPFVTAISPNVGPIGTTVTITGFNFNSVETVTFNTTSTVNFTIDSNTQITVTVPPNSSTGPVMVSGPTGTAVGPTFTVIRTK
ncbi:MAG: IPT/TIG domain-containing protein, partial [Blastocatellia bacterium]|nr:IPT/TIG domain-containing protein [Blastocatellia bacterium]